MITVNNSSKGTAVLFFLAGIVISAVDCQHVTLDPMKWWFCLLVLWGGCGEALEGDTVMHQKTLPINRPGFPLAMSLDVHEPSVHEPSPYPHLPGFPIGCVTGRA